MAEAMTTNTDALVAKLRVPHKREDCLDAAAVIESLLDMHTANCNVTLMRRGLTVRQDCNCGWERAEKAEAEVQRQSEVIEEFGNALGHTEAKATKLREYVLHKPDCTCDVMTSRADGFRTINEPCGKVLPCRSHPDSRCKCGLDEALATGATEDGGAE